MKWIALGLIALILLPSVSTQTCPVFGSDLTEKRTAYRAGLFLNFEGPAQCNGTAKAWHYCYYGRDITDPFVFAADFVVYRKTSLNSNVYERVVLKSVVKSPDDLQSTGFHCETVTLEQSEYFAVQEDDIIGACLIEDGTQTRINIMSHQVNGHGEVYRPSRNTELCDPSLFELVDFGGMFEQGRHVVHLYIDIETQEVTSPSGAAPSPSTAETHVTSTSMTIGQISSNHNDVYSVLPTVSQLQAVTELLAVTQISTRHTTHLSTGLLTLDLPTPLPSNQINDKESTSGLNTAVIAGTAIGCALFGLVLAIAFLSVFCMARKRRKFCCKTVDATTVTTQGVAMHINIQRPALEETRYSVPPRPRTNLEC